MDSHGSGLDVIVAAPDSSRRFFPWNRGLTAAFGNNTGEI